MCGRYLVISGVEVLRRRFGFSAVERIDVAPRYNVAPRQRAPVILGSDPTVLTGAEWGLLPSWARPETASRPINARAETLSDRTSFRSALERRRCLVPADGWYEWQPSGPGGRKQPYLLRPGAAGPFAFAGLWERSGGPGESSLLTFTIVTTVAAPEIREIHDRAPVILAREAEALWLAPRPLGEGEISLCLRAVPSGPVLFRPVSNWVGSPRNEGPACVAPPAKVTAGGRAE